MTEQDVAILKATIKDLALARGLGTPTKINSFANEVVKAYLEHTEPNTPKSQPIPVSQKEYVTLANQVADIVDRERKNGEEN